MFGWGRGLVSPRRLQLAFVLASAIVLVAAGIAVALYDESQYRLQTTEAASVQARVLANTVTAALVSGDHEALQNYANALRANSGVDAVGIFDDQGRRVASFTRSHIADRLSQVKTAATAPGQVIVFAPVAQGGVKRGTVYLRDRTEPVARRLSRYIAPGFLVLMASLMFAVMSLDARALRRANRDLEAQIEEREKVEAALRQSQKMEAIGRLTGGIAHDFNNMLGIVMGNLDLLLRRFSDGDPKLVRLAEHAMEGAKRAAALTQRLLAFSRLGETVAVETVSAGGLWRAHIDLPQLETAIVNLAINSRDAMPNGGKLTIETGNAYLDRAYAEADEDVKPGQYVMVAITDTGVGIPANVLGQVFEPFFTTKPTGMGTGLGLSQVQGFIKQSGGHIRIYSEVGVGTTVKLYLPRSQTDLDRPVAGALRSKAPGRQGGARAAGRASRGRPDADRCGDAGNQRPGSRRGSPAALAQAARGFHDRLYPQRHRAQRRGGCGRPPGEQTLQRGPARRGAGGGAGGTGPVLSQHRPGFVAVGLERVCDCSDRR